MISINFLRKANNLVSMKASGHAGFDEYGKDIVCSAVSALSVAILNGITDVMHFEPAFHIDEDGFLSISIENLHIEQIEACQVLMETLLLGLQNIEINYGKYINVKVEEV
ncbi:ribosomal-processing cysteine protease Prp [Clostridium sp. P21]|uniref:Ribosomal processing cysteine protease Prp n=1 Tax=Clostridium muellerianum TaxID=2716538 RepID=A0A7Y0HR70_9CLOT|nr:ribosomal-processing cysteine protease Prp [Clostridium muellerianum]NMM64548.1 ribosomal-processing cysteine protease Prp [Clostridium muellerianum]